MIVPPEDREQYVATAVAKARACIEADAEDRALRGRTDFRVSASGAYPDTTIDVSYRDADGREVVVAYPIWDGTRFVSDDGKGVQTPEWTGILISIDVLEPGLPSGRVTYADADAPER